MMPRALSILKQPIVRTNFVVPCSISLGVRSLLTIPVSGHHPWAIGTLLLRAGSILFIPIILHGAAHILSGG